MFKVNNKSTRMIQWDAPFSVVWIIDLEQVNINKGNGVVGNNSDYLPSAVNF